MYDPNDILKKPFEYELPKIDPLPQIDPLPKIELPKEDPLKYVKYTGPPYFDDGLPRFSNGMLVPPPGNPLSPF